MPPPSAPDAFRAKLIESRVSLHPIERARLFRSLLPHASRDPQRVADLLFSFLSRERSRDSDDDHAIDLIGAAAKNGCREFVDALFERLVEGAAGLPDKAGNAIVKIAEIFLNMNAQKRYGAKNHPFSRVAAVRRDLLAGLGQAVDTGLENGVLFSNFEGYLEFLLSNPVVGGETDAQLTISSVFHYLEAAACWEFVDFIRETLLLSPLAPPSLIIHACRAMFNKNDEGSEKYYLAGLAKLVSMDHRAILPDILGMYTNFQEPEHPALAFLEIAAVCLVAYPGVEPKLADELACWLVSHLEQLPLGCGVAASLVLAFLVNQSAERGGVPDAKIAEADRMLGSDEDEDSLDELLESVTTFVGEHAKHFASPGMSLLKSDVLLFLQTLASPTPTTPTFTSPLFTPSLLLLSIETAPSASHIPALLHTLRNPRTPHSTMNSLRSISRLASPSAPFATSLAVRLALSLPSAALKLSLLRNSAEKHGRIWRVWMGEVKDWVRNRIRFRESQRGLGKTEVLRARSKETEDEEVVQVICATLSAHPTTLGPPLFPVLLALLTTDLLNLDSSRLLWLRGVTTSLRLGVGDPRTAWSVVLKKLVSETALQSGLIEFYGVAGEAWDGSEGYSLFLNEEILPLLLPLAMGSTPSAEAQAALSRFPAELLNPLLPNPPAVLPSIKSPELLAALLSNEASGMRRSLLRGSGGGIAKREVAPSLLEGARAAAGVLEGLAEKPPRAGGKPGFLLGALHAAANSGAGAPSVVLGKREKAIADGVQGLGGVLLSDQVILGRLGLVEGFIRGFEGVWRLCSVVAENAIATGSKPISTRERAEKWADDLIGKIKDPKSPLEAGNAALASAGLTVSLVRAGEAEVGTRIGRGLLPLFLEGGEGNDEVGAARMVAIARVAAVVIDRTDEKGWLRVVEALKAGIEGEGWTRWSAAVAMGGVLRSVPNNFVAFDMGLQSLLSLPDSEVGKGIGLAACAAAVKEADPQLFDELIEVAMVNLDGFLARKPTAKTAEFAGIDGAAFFAGWSAPLLSPEQRGRAKSLLLKAFESINDKKDLALHAQFAIALSHSFANDPDSASEHTARLASIANAATPSFSSLVSIPSLLGHDILSSQLSPTAIDSAADPAPASKLLSKLTSIASTSAELRMARMSATVSGKICGVTLEADSGPTLLGGKKEPADLSRLDKETSAIRAVFEALSAEPNELLVDALTRIEVALPAVDWLPLMNGLWNSGDGNRKSLLLSFFSRHCVVSGSRSLLDFLVSRCDPKVWGSLDIQLQERILGDAGIGKLLDIAGLEPAEPDLDEPEAAEETPKMTIAPTKLLSLISASFDEALSKPEPTALQFVLLATLHDRLAEHRTGSHSETAEIPLAAQLASLLCRVFATMPTPTDPISLRLLRLCTESIACDSRVFEYFLGGDADGDPAHDVVKVCVAWELSARSKAVADFGMSVPALLSAILENEFSAMDPGAGRRARMFAVMQALAVQLGADEEAESRQLLTGKEARLPKGLRTALARRTVVMRWLGRLLDTGIVVGSGTPEALSEYMWLVLGSFVEMAFRGDWWDLEPLHAEGPDAETEESTRRFEFEPELVEAEDGIVLAGRLGRLLSTLLSTTMATDSKRFPEVVSQHTACTQILRRVLRVHSAAKAISSGTHIELAVLAGLREVLNGNRILLDALVAAEREAWTELA